MNLPGLQHTGPLAIDMNQPGSFLHWSVTVATWARLAPADFLATAATELDGTSETPTYGPPYNDTSGAAQKLLFSPQTWFGVTQPVDTAQDFVLGPLSTLAADDPAIAAPLATYRVSRWARTPARLPITVTCLPALDLGGSLSGFPRTEVDMAAIPSGTVPVPESRPGWPAPLDRMLENERAGLDDQALLGIVRLSPQASERRAAACELLVSRYKGLVRSCVRPYLRSPEPAEDLMQVGYIGLLKAISNFDPAAGCSLATYARPCISGELKRHFRDKRWQVRVKRPVQELVLEVRKATWRLAQELGRTPTETDIARHLGVSGDDLRQARRAELAFWPHSLDAPLPGQPSMMILADVLGEEDPRLEHMLGMQAVATHWGELPAREQEVLRMDFRGGMTQAQIGQRLRMSQMQVSRLRSHALGYLRSRLLDLEGTSAAMH